MPGNDSEAEIGLRISFPQGRQTHVLPLATKKSGCQGQIIAFSPLATVSPIAYPSSFLIWASVASGAVRRIRSASRS